MEKISKIKKRNNANIINILITFLFIATFLYILFIFQNNHLLLVGLDEPLELDPDELLELDLDELLELDPDEPLELDPDEPLELDPDELLELDLDELLELDPDEPITPPLEAEPEPLLSSSILEEFPELPEASPNIPVFFISEILFYS